MKITKSQLRQIIQEVLNEKRRRPRSLSKQVRKIRGDLGDEAIESEARLDAIENRLEDLSNILDVVTTELDRADIPGMAPVSPKLRHQSRLGPAGATGLSMADPGRAGGPGPAEFDIED